MKRGYVKFFDTRAGKRFGFLVDGENNELFFHYSDGCGVRLDHNQDIVLEQAGASLRYPQAGDRLVFKLGRNYKGPKAAQWCFAPDYDQLVEKRKRDLTLDEAKRLLGPLHVKVHRYTHTRTPYSWLDDTEITHNTEISWSNRNKCIALGGFWREFRGKVDESLDQAVLKSGTFRVTVYSPDDQRYRTTVFKGEEALALEELGAGSTKVSDGRTV